MNLNSKMCLAFGFLACMTASYAHAEAPCASFSVARDDLRTNYNPFAANEDRTNFVLRAEKGNSDVAEVRALLKDASPRGGVPVIGTDGPAEYSIYLRNNDNQRIFDWRSGTLTGSNGLTFTYRDSRSVSTANLVLLIPAQQPSGAARHVQALEVAYACYNAAGALIGSGTQTSQDVLIDLNVTRIFGAYTGSLGNRAGTIDFGPIDVRAASIVSGRAAVTALSSVRYGMTIRSERGFQIRQSPNGQGLPYAATLDGMTVSQDGRFSCARTGAAGREHQLALALDTRGAANLPAGDYSDTLTITFLARDGADAAPRGSCVAGD
jgi:spore coat protein U-like protein